MITVTFTVTGATARIIATTKQVVTGARPHPTARKLTGQLLTIQIYVRQTIFLWRIRVPRLVLCHQGLQDLQLPHAANVLMTPDNQQRQRV
jgi:hypothetical protein